MAASAAVAGAGLHLTAVLLAIGLSPWHDTIGAALSDLGMGAEDRTRLLVNLGAFIVPGALLIATCVCGRRCWSIDRTGARGLQLIATTGVSLVVVGAFPFPSRLHLLGAGLGALTYSAGALMFGQSVARRVEVAWWGTLGAVVGLAVAVDLAMGFIANLRQSPLHSYMGAQQRLVLSSAVIWFATSAVLLSVVCWKQRAAA